MGRKRPDFRIVPLAEAPKAAPTLARWFVEEWASWYGPGGPGDAEGDIAACLGGGRLPVCLVALDARGEVLGTAALKSESAGSELGVGPWLAALLVGEGHRDRGVGTALVAAIEEEARRLGFGAIYASTDVAEGVLKRQGWREFGATLTLRGPIRVYRLELGPDGPPPVPPGGHR